MLWEEIQSFLNKVPRQSYHIQKPVMGTITVISGFKEGRGSLTHPQPDESQVSTGRQIPHGNSGLYPSGCSSGLVDGVSTFHRCLPWMCLLDNLTSISFASLFMTPLVCSGFTNAKVLPFSLATALWISTKVVLRVHVATHDCPSHYHSEVIQFICNFRQPFISKQQNGLKLLLCYTGNTNRAHFNLVVWSFGGHLVHLSQNGLYLENSWSQSELDYGSFLRKTRFMVHDGCLHHDISSADSQVCE